jgi:RND superfamily putative drug exporter
VFVMLFVVFRSALAALAAHFPAASANPLSLLLYFSTPIWDHPGVLARAQQQLTATGSPPGILRALSGPLDPNGTPLSVAQLVSLHSRLGPAVPPALRGSQRSAQGAARGAGPQGALSAPPRGTAVPARVYAAYRATAQFISPDGRTLQYYALAAAGPAGSTAALDAIPAIRATLAATARATGAQAYGVAGQDAASYDILQSATGDLQRVLPIVLAVIAVLLALLLRSLVAPWYLIVTVGLSYLAALGFATLVFVRLGGDASLNFVIPFLLFVFAMALGEDYNILLMSRIREEAHHAPLGEALTRAIGLTGGTITSAGVILGGTFAVLGLAGNTDQARQLGFTIAFAVFLDTFFVRTLLVPSIAVLLGRWNWWPSRLARATAEQRPGTATGRTTGRLAGPPQAPPAGGTL